MKPRLTRNEGDLSNLRAYLKPPNCLSSIMAESGRMYQRQKYYCHMCHKQCRDEHGFRCHKTSASHQRNMLLFIEAPDHYIEQFSSEFEQEFSKVLEARFPTQWVQAGKVYGLSLASRKQTHLNSTKWESLEDFVEYLREKGDIEVEENEATGLMICKKAREEAKPEPSSRALKEDDNSVALRRVMKVATEVQRTTKYEETAYSPIDPTLLPSSFSITAREPPSRPIPVSALLESETTPQAETPISHPSAVDYITHSPGNSKRKREEAGRYPSGLVLKVVDRTSAFFNQKGVVRTSNREGVALELGNRRVESFLYTEVQNVVPNVGGEVAILTGKHEGLRGKVVGIRVKESVLDVQVEGTVIPNLPFTSICKCSNSP